MAGVDAEVVELPRLAVPDGFLATGSVLQMVVMLLRAFLDEPGLPPQISPSSGESELREEVLVLAGPSLMSVAADIEVRLVESGFASVQVADFRNFAHGRHTGFDRRRDRTTVIVISDSATEGLATATADLLPGDTDIQRWHHDGPWPAALLALLTRSMGLVQDVGDAQGVDPARPKVPVYGRRLYRLPLAKRVPAQTLAGVDRKLLALGAGDSAELRGFFSAAGKRWAAELGEQYFGGLVLDYDGTVCWTKRRRELPDRALQLALLGLLSEGMTVGLASGRGKSLHRDLRKWIPKKHWPDVIVGLYNGAVRLWLDESLPDLRPPTPWSEEVVRAIDQPLVRERIEIEERGAQVSVTLSDAVFHDGLASLLRARLASAGVAAQVVSSGHSVDIVATTTCKTAVTESVGERIEGREILAIGDQGQIGGNDHALLAFGSWSLTVDAGSGDPTRCWFGGNGDRVGPDLLLRYLKKLKRRREGFTIKGLPVH